MAQANIIDGKAEASILRERVAQAARVAGLRPRIDVVLVGDDPASQVYVRSKERAAAQIGFAGKVHRVSASVAEADLIDAVRRLNADPEVDGILVQLPLPNSLDASRVLDAIDPVKDVDGFHPLNVGLLASGRPGAVPCTPLGCLLLLRQVLGSLRGRSALVLGRSTIVGRPMAQLLLGEDATVTIAHSATRDLPGECRRADILVVATGRPGLVRGTWVRPGAVVIDVGINRLDDGSLAGDVAYDEVRPHAAAITPVPGGVGPMTIACLLANTLRAAALRRGLPEPLPLHRARLQTQDQ